MPKAIQIFLRSAWYILKLGVLAVIVVLLMIGAFTIGRNLSNFYILITDGLNCRTSVVLDPEQDSAQLYKYFSRDFIQKDQVVKTTAYEDYNITRFEPRISVEWMWIWPWEETGYAIVQDTVPRIEGSIPEEIWAEDAMKEAVKDDPPDWYNARYSVQFKKDADDRWFIADMIVLEELPEPPIPTLLTLPPTPEPSTPPTPSPTPTPIPTPSPTPEETPEE